MSRNDPPSPPSAVFVDPTGRRARITRIVGLLVATAAGIVLLVTAAGLSGVSLPPPWRWPAAITGADVTAREPGGSGAERPSARPSPTAPLVVVHGQSPAPASPRARPAPPVPTLQAAAPAPAPSPTAQTATAVSPQPQPSPAAQATAPEQAQGQRPHERPEPPRDERAAANQDRDTTTRRAQPSPAPRRP